MKYNIQYKPLFTLNILHSYFLDNGETAFNDTEKPGAFSNYNVNDYIKIKPSQRTEQVLKNHKLIFKPTASGITCLVQAGHKVGTEPKLFEPKIDISDLTFDILLYVTDPLFEKYTEIDPLKNSLFSFPYDGEPGFQLNILADNPSTEITNYSVVDAEAKKTLMEKLTPKESIGLLGLVSIKASSLLTGSTINDPVDELKIAFKNRKTIWRYLDQSGAEVYSTAQRVLPQNKALPFVKKGNITVTGTDSTTYRMANPSDTMDTTSEPNITEIYI